MGAAVIVRHADHGPEVICRPAGHGLCEPAPDGARLGDWREAYGLNVLDVPDH